jgi:chemotaxis protein methyltransferase CheR
MELNTITEREYIVIRNLLFKHSGISLGPNKKTLVAGRLFKRVQALGFSCYGDYFNLLATNKHPDELQTAIDLLTTNETYFFREPKHFSVLSDIATQTKKDHIFRVWSAACSTGEEVYSIAMTLQELTRQHKCQNWEVRGSDISTRVLEQAERGLYSMDRTDGIPPDYLKRYCLQGTGPYQGCLLIDRSLREKAQFAQINLIHPLPELVPFDVIFLRNILIYFEAPEKRKILNQLLSALTPDGVLFIGLAETLHGIIDGWVNIGPGAYRIDRRSKKNLDDDPVFK